MKPPSGLAILLSDKTGRDKDSTEADTVPGKKAPQYDDDLKDVFTEFEESENIEDRIDALKTFIQMCQD